MADTGPALAKWIYLWLIIWWLNTDPMDKTALAQQNGWCCPTWVCCLGSKYQCECFVWNSVAHLKLFILNLMHCSVGNSEVVLSLELLPCLMCSAPWGCNNYNNCSQNKSLAAQIIASKPQVPAISGYSSGTQQNILIKQVNDLESKEPYRNLVPFINTSDLTSHCVPTAQCWVSSISRF